jgi:hypothetical protein
MLVGRQPPSTGEVAQFFGGNTLNGGRFMPTYQGLQQRPNHDYFFDWLPVDDEAKRADIDISVPIPLQVVRFPVSAGVAFDVDGVRLTVKSVHKTSLEGTQFIRQQAMQAWAIDYSLEGAPAKAQIRLHPVLLDKAGKPLTEDNRTTANDHRILRRYWNGIFDLTTPTPSGGHWFIQRNPREVGFIEIHPVYRRIVTFHDIALEPKL